MEASTFFCSGQMIVRTKAHLKLCFGVIFLLCTSCKQIKNNIVQTDLTEVNKETLKEFEDYLSTPYKLKSSVISLVEFLPKNHSINGDKDYTGIIQKVLDTYRDVLFPNFPLYINDTGLNISSNSNLYFPDKSILKFNNSSKVLYSILLINGQENINLFNPKIEGDRYRRINSENEKGEWGMGLLLRSAHNIKVYSPQISNCWGDGIYLGEGIPSKPNEAIEITNALLTNNRRNGISIISGKRILIKHALVTNTNGTNPQAGIDIEPNKPGNTIEDIRIINSITKNNKGYGILIALGAMLDDKRKEVSITINEHYDEGSNIGFRLAGASNKKNALQLGGAIKIDSPIWISNSRSFLINENFKLLPSVYIRNAKNNELTTSVLGAEKSNELKNKNVFIIND